MTYLTYAFDKFIVVFRPLRPNEIVKRAKGKIGEEGYNVFNENCEHFATWCRYDKASSHQVQKFKKNPPVFVLKSVRGAVRKPPKPQYQ